MNRNRLMLHSSDFRNAHKYVPETHLPGAKHLSQQLAVCNERKVSNQRDKA